MGYLQYPRMIHGPQFCGNSQSVSQLQTDGGAVLPRTAHTLRHMLQRLGKSSNKVVGPCTVIPSGPHMLQRLGKSSRKVVRPRTSIPSGCHRLQGCR